MSVGDDGAPVQYKVCVLCRVHAPLSLTLRLSP